MESRPVENFWGRYALFMGLAMGLLLLNLMLFPPSKNKDGQQGDIKARQDLLANAPADEAAEGGQDQVKPDLTADESPDKESPDEESPDDESPDDESPDEESPDAQPADEPLPKKEIPKAPVAPARFATLGSVDPVSPYRMLATFTSQGAAVVRIELSSRKFRDLEDRSGYLGHIVINTAAEGAGCKVDVVGAGTPAAKAGLRPGDLIEFVNEIRVTSFRILQKALAETKPGQDIGLTVSRDDKEIKLTATLGRRPLEVVRPEKDDPLSFLLTLYQVDDAQLPIPPDEEESEKDDEKGRTRSKEDVPRDELLFREIAGLDLRTGNWALLDPNDDPKNPEDWQVNDEGEDAAADQPRDRVRFARWLPQWDLVVVKTYQLAKVPTADQKDLNAKSYHLQFDIEIHNVGPKARNVAYQLDGPTGLPTEGSWYANKVGPGWGIYGLRDILVSFDKQQPDLIQCTDIANATVTPPLWKEGPDPLLFIGVDAQYFSSVLIPQRDEKSPREIWFAQSRPIRVGAVNGDFKKITNTSCRVRSKEKILEPGKTFSHRYEIFAGPKRPPLLDQYGLIETVFYGWFWWAAKPMLVVLHFFQGIVFSYGLAIIMLTILVRGSMFPLSRKQAMGARKMQQLQPEIRKIMDKYKDDMEGRAKAQQELFKKHDYHPLGGCWVIFIQMPIFIGLYRSLMVDVELRQAPLLWDGIRWCSNLAAPDMLIPWGGFWENVGLEWVIRGHDPSFMTMLAFGPYFNLLPCLTIVLFLVQQKMLMPPATDEQTAMQQNIMKYMMVLMGLMFFKVAAGLCIYFIASSLWGVAERQLLPKAKPGDSASKPKTPKPGMGSSAERVKREAAEPAKKIFPGLLSAGDGTAARKKKMRKGRKKK